MAASCHKMSLTPNVPGDILRLGTFWGSTPAAPLVARMATYPRSHVHNLSVSVSLCLCLCLCPCLHMSLCILCVMCGSSEAATVKVIWFLLHFIAVDCP